MVFREYFSFVFYLIQARSDVAARSSGCTNKLDEKSWADQITNKISREKRTNFQQRGRRMPQQQPEKHHHISSLDNLKNNNRKKITLPFAIYCIMFHLSPSLPALFSTRGGSAIVSLICPDTMHTALPVTK